MARKRKEAPVVLRELFGKRVRSLAETILALIPPPPVDGSCLCKGRRCLSCTGSEAMSFLVNSGDPPGYRKLLYECLVVVSENAPPVTVHVPDCHWRQREIVRRSIEIMLQEQPSSSNLICFNYDRFKRTSAVVDELTSPNWKLLLRKIGDALMVHLLRYTSLFLPVTRMGNHQISGCPISNLCYKSPKQIPEPKHLLHPLAGRKKRKLVEGVEFIPRKQMCTRSLCSDSSLNSSSFVAGTGSSVSKEDISNGEREGSSMENALALNKLKRSYGWQRKRKRRQSVAQDEPLFIPCGENNCNNDKLSFSASSFQRDQSKLSHCFCCSVFQNVTRMNRKAEITRHIFYKLESSTSIFPRKHILHTIKPNVSGATSLFNNIFGTCVVNKSDAAVACSHRKNGHPINSTCLYHSFTKLLKSVISSSKDCRVLSLLEKHCPTNATYQYASGSDVRKNSTRRHDVSRGYGKLFHAADTQNHNTVLEVTSSHVEPRKCCCPKKDVVSFIWAVCRRIVPSPLLGEPSNWKILRKNISKFVHLRRYEKFSLNECINKLKITKFPLLSNMHTGCGVTDITRHAIFDCWMFWFFAHLVSPLLQANFYVTETDHEKYEVLYYRKSTWEKLMTEVENSRRFSLLSYASTKEIIWNRSFGFSKARLRPKKKGLRILTNLGAPSRMPAKQPFYDTLSNLKLRRKEFRDRQVYVRFFKSVNNVLDDLRAVLKGLMTKEAEKLGSSVFGLNDIYKKLVPFLFLLKKGSCNLPNVFMVVSDVSKAFDSVDQRKLISVMNDVLVDNEFTLEKLTQVTFNKKSLMVRTHQVLANQDIAAASATISSRFRAHSFDSVIVKKEFSRKIRKEEVLCLLKEHITRNVVKLGKSFYLQKIGITQGSVLSTPLCSFYYGHMESNVIFPFLESANMNFLGNQDPLGTSTSRGNHQKDCEHLMLRFVDDFLFMSTSEKQASMFFSRMEKGVRDYNISMNIEKYGANFNSNDGRQCHSNKLHVGKDGIAFLRWGGLLLNSSTLEIQADYTRYLNYHLSSTLTVISQGKVGSHLKTKLRSFLRPKCHALFYDSNINSPGVVRLNIYQAFLICAMKFICYLSKFSSPLCIFSPTFCTNAMYNSINYMNKLIKRRMYTIKIDRVFRPKYDVKKKEVRWLGLHAYTRVIRKRQSRYKELLSFLNRKLSACSKEVNMSNELKYAIDDTHSTAVWGIKY